MQPMPDIATLLKIAQSPAGQQLLNMLKAGNPNDLNNIMATASSGDLEDAKQKLSTMLTSQEAQELLKQLEKQL